MTVHDLKPDLAKGSGSFFSYGLHKTIVMRAIDLPLFSRLRAKRKEFTSRFADRKAALRIGQAQNSRRRAGGNLDRAQEHARQIIWRVLHVVFRGEHFRDVLAASGCADARRCHWLTPVPAAGVASSAPPKLVMRWTQELMPRSILSRWLPHTTRAALSGLRKRGFAAAIDRSDKERGSIYRIKMDLAVEDSAAAHSDVAQADPKSPSNKAHRQAKSKARRAA